MKKLTRILALTLCCLLAAGLAACGETPAPTPDPDPGSAIGGNTQIPNPRVPYENDEFPDFKLVGYPDRDSMKPTGFSSAAPSGRSPMKPPPCAVPPIPARARIFPAFTTPMPRRASFRWGTATATALLPSP